MGFDDAAINYFLSSDHKAGDDLIFCEHYFENMRFKRLLDVATAAGHFTKPFNADFKVAADLSINMLKTARDKNQLDSAVLCRAEKLPFKDEVFDIVTCRIAMHHFQSPTDFFKETHRVLKKGGFFVLIDSIVDIDNLFLNKIEFIRDKTHKKSLTILEIMELADSLFRLLAFRNIFKKHKFTEWATRLNPTKETLLKTEKAFLDLPKNMKNELKVEIKSGRVVSYTDKKGIFIFRKI